MFLIRLVRSLLSLYTLLLLFRHLMPYVFQTRRPWMATVEQLCAPADRMGRELARRFFPAWAGRNETGGGLMGVIVCYLLTIIIGWIA